MIIIVPLLLFINFRIIYDTLTYPVVSMSFNIVAIMVISLIIVFIFRYFYKLHTMPETEMKFVGKTLVALMSIILGIFLIGGSYGLALGAEGRGTEIILTCCITGFILFLLGVYVLLIAPKIPEKDSTKKF